MSLPRFCFVIFEKETLVKSSWSENFEKSWWGSSGIFTTCSFLLLWQIFARIWIQLLIESFVTYSDICSQSKHHNAVSIEKRAILRGLKLERANEKCCISHSIRLRYLAYCVFEIILKYLTLSYFKYFSRCDLLSESSNNTLILNFKQRISKKDFHDMIVYFVLIRNLGNLWLN